MSSSMIKPVGAAADAAADKNRFDRLA